MNNCPNLTKLKNVGQNIIVCSDKNECITNHVANIENSNVSGGIFILDFKSPKVFLQSSFRFKFPAVFMKPKIGGISKDYIKIDPKARVSIQFGKIEMGSKPTPSVAIYSSRGSSASCPFVLKLDVIVPEDLILVSWPPNRAVFELNSKLILNNFNKMSGTSVACLMQQEQLHSSRRAHLQMEPCNCPISHNGHIWFL